MTNKSKLDKVETWEFSNQTSRQKLFQFLIKLFPFHFFWSLLLSEDRWIFQTYELAQPHHSGGSRLDSENPRKKHKKKNKRLTFVLSDPFPLPFPPFLPLLLPRPFSVLSGTPLVEPLPLKSVACAVKVSHKAPWAALLAGMVPFPEILVPTERWLFVESMFSRKTQYNRISGLFGSWGCGRPSSRNFLPASLLYSFLRLHKATSAQFESSSRDALSTYSDSIVMDPSDWGSRMNALRKANLAAAVLELLYFSSNPGRSPSNKHFDSTKNQQGLLGSSW